MRYQTFLSAIICFILSPHGSTAQGGFNSMHEAICADQPLIVAPWAQYQQVFTLTNAQGQADGYLALGAGILSQNPEFEDLQRAFVSRIDTLGNVVWCKRWDNPEVDSITLFDGYVNIIATRTYDGNFAVMMRNAAIDSADNRVEIGYLIRFNADGDILSKKRIDHPWRYFKGRVMEDPRDSCLILHGECRYFSESPNAGQWQPALVRLDRNDEIRQVLAEITEVPATDRGLYSWLLPFGDSDFFVRTIIDVDLILCNGIQWGRWDDTFRVLNNELSPRADMNIYNDLGCFEAIAPLSLSLDTILMIGRENYSPEGTTCATVGVRYFHQRITYEGESIAIHPRHSLPNACNWHEFMNAQRTPEGDIYICGNWSSPGNASLRGFIYKTNEQGDSLWFKRYHILDGHEQNEHRIWDTDLTLDGGIVCAGGVMQRSGDPYPGANAPWIFKVDSHGCIEPGCQFATQVEEVVIGLTDAMRVYPNPAETLTTVSFALPAGVNMDKASHLVLFDLTGKELQRIVVPAFASTHTLELDTSALPSGVYSLQWVQQERWLDAFTLVRK
jgi:hypothetical protein